MVIEHPIEDPRIKDLMEDRMTQTKDLIKN